MTSQLVRCDFDDGATVIERGAPAADGMYFLESGEARAARSPFTLQNPYIQKEG